MTALHKRDNFLKKTFTDPEWIVSELDKYIIGQEHIKKLLSVAAFQRAYRLLQSHGIISPLPEFQKSNILLLGQTGSGKTAVVKAFAEILDIPILIYDITSTTSAGYIGMKLENVIGNYFQQCWDHIQDKYTSQGKVYGHDYGRDALGYETINMAETGIIYIDEFDKCRKTSDQSSLDIVGLRVQQELLKFFEGDSINVSKDEQCSRMSLTEFKTKNLLVICGGAFQGLNQIIAKRLQNKSAIGFNSNVDIKSEIYTHELFKQVTSQDLIDYGFIPELVGRIAYTAPLDKITIDMVKAIILDSKNSVFRQYQNMFEQFEIDLILTKKALELIAENALKSKTGARGINAIFHKIMLEVQYQIFKLSPGTLRITDKTVRDILKNG